jgi:hypothetical protein
MDYLKSDSELDSKISALFQAARANNSDADAKFVAKSMTAIENRKFESRLLQIIVPIVFSAFAIIACYLFFPTIEILNAMSQTRYLSNVQEFPDILPYLILLFVLIYWATEEGNNFI